MGMELDMSTTERAPVPRDRENDYTHDAAASRREFVTEKTGVELEHVGSYSFDPELVQGNVEHFTGVAQSRWASRGPCWWTASTRRASSTSRWPPPRGRSWPPTTAA